MSSLHNAPRNHLVTPDSNNASRDSHKFFQSTLSPGRTFASANRHSYVSERVQQWHWDSSRLSWHLVRSIKAETIVRLSNPRIRPAFPPSCSYLFAIIEFIRNRKELPRSGAMIPRWGLNSVEIEYQSVSKEPESSRDTPWEM